MHKNLLRSMMRKLKPKVEYADIRWVKRHHENISAFNYDVENLSCHIDEGYGIRVLYNGAWGFACGSIFEEKAAQMSIRLAIEIAKASSSVNQEKISFPEQPAVHASYASNCQINPFEVSQEIKLHYLFIPMKSS